MFSLLSATTKCWANSWNVSDLRPHDAHVISLVWIISAAFSGNMQLFGIFVFVCDELLFDVLNDGKWHFVVTGLIHYDKVMFKYSDAHVISLDWIISAAFSGNTQLFGMIVFVCDELLFDVLLDGKWHFIVTGLIHYDKVMFKYSSAQSDLSYPLARKRQIVIMVFLDRC